MVDFKLARIKRYAKLANNKASQQFIPVTKDVLKQKGHVQKSQKQLERGVLRNLVLWKWLFHNAGEMNFWLKSLKNILEDVHLYLSCMLLSYNFTKKRTTSFSIF